METIVHSLRPVRAELIKEARMSASPQSTQLPVARMLRPQTAAERYILTTDVTIAGGVKLTADPCPTVSATARDCNHAAPCNLLLGFVGGASSRQTAPSIRACYVTASECPNMPSGDSEGGGLLRTLASA